MTMIQNEGNVISFYIPTNLFNDDKVGLFRELLLSDNLTETINIIKDTNSNDEILKQFGVLLMFNLIQYNNEPIDLLYLANKLCVSKRKIPKDIKVLQNNNLIEVIPNFTQGSQRRNIIKYIGPQKDITGKELTL